MLVMNKKNQFTVKRLIRKPNIVEVGKFKCSDISCFFGDCNLFGDDSEEKTYLYCGGDITASGLMSENSEYMCKMNFYINLAAGNQEQAEKYYIALALSDEEFNETVRVFLDTNRREFIFIFSDLADTYYTGCKFGIFEESEDVDIEYDAENGMLSFKFSYILSNCTQEFKDYIRDYFKHTNRHFQNIVQSFGLEAAKVLLRNNIIK